ncbi:PLAC8-domain-containing protein [Serendipita vermifera]|nr:PLAC8-domain-containing protein [Serendipita vermifera]
MGSGGGNRNVKNIPFDSKGEREWSNGLCSCFGDCLTCIVAAWCPCIVFSQNKTRLQHMETQGYPHPEGGESCGSDCMLHCLLTACLGAGWILQIGNREKIRSRYRIEGGTCGDCCVSWCCHSCALTQESRELELEERSMLPPDHAKH